MAINPTLLRRTQLIGTGVLALFCTPGFLCFAYMSATRANHRPSEAVFLLLVALLVPPLFYWAMNGIAAMHRASQPDADPQRRSTRFMKSRYASLPVFVSIGLAIGLSRQLVGFDPSVAPELSVAQASLPPTRGQLEAMRSSCMASMAETLRRAGAAEAPAMTEHYCACVVNGAQSRLTQADLRRMDLDPARAENDPLLRGVTNVCLVDLEAQASRVSRR